MNTKAYSLLEVLLVLAVTAIMSIVVVRYYSAVKEREKLTALIQQYADITTAIQKCVHINLSMLDPSDTTTINCFDFSDLIQAGFLDDSIESNPWGNKSSGFSNNLKQGSDNFSFQVTSSNVPKLSCAKIMDSAASKLPATKSINYTTSSCIYEGYTQNT